MKTYFQNIHYNRINPNALIKCVLGFGEFFYKNIIQFKNFLYEKNILTSAKVNPYVICVGNLTTGGVGKTPIVINIANSFNEPVAIISRGYSSKLKTKKPVVVKDFDGLKFFSGDIIGDEPFQTAKNTLNHVVVIISKDRVLGAQLACEKYKINTVILDDGFSNRKIKKDKTYLVIDSKMRFGNNHLLPLGPLREPVGEIKRADEIIVVNKGDKNYLEAVDFIKKNYNKPLKVSLMEPKRIYNIQTKASQINPRKAIAFCAIGQAGQFFDFAKQYYDLIETVEYPDHYKYTKKDIEKLISLAEKNNINTFITTQKDESKLIDLIKDIKKYSFNVLELKTVIKSI